MSPNRLTDREIAQGAIGQEIQSVTSKDAQITPEVLNQPTSTEDIKKAQRSVEAMATNEVFTPTQEEEMIQLAIESLRNPEDLTNNIGEVTRLLKTYREMAQEDFSLAA